MHCWLEKLTNDSEDENEAVDDELLPWRVLDNSKKQPLK